MILESEKMVFSKGQAAIRVLRISPKNINNERSKGATGSGGGESKGATGAVGAQIQRSKGATGAGGAQKEQRNNGLEGAQRGKGYRRRSYR